MSPAGQLLLPALVLLPLLALLPASWHGGGFDLIGQFLVAAVQPSTDPALIAASLRGIAVTVAVALWSWLFSLLLGVIGGVLSAEVVSRTLWGCSWPALLL
ncbi:MAG TPA: phosphonate ABC transporter, partial [Synechococcales bacterium UBA8647]|nr:phosphonate ABC transporter [Synechococcales bacterium UBA8647]